MDEEIVASWVSARSHERTRAWYRADVALFRAFVGKPLRAVTPDDVRAYAEHLAAAEPDALIRKRVMKRVEALVEHARYSSAGRADRVWHEGCQGWVVRHRILPLAADVYVCEECDATWTNLQAVNGAGAEYLTSFLERHGLRDRLRWWDIEGLVGPA